ncbi:hypothetical protein ACQEV9_15555 [Streptomyces chartreusis]|uniref:hypothetical protein n=1 Tax=Streptomyces chartreusis TaxID=1969 RepID=UPI003D940971
MAKREFGFRIGNIRTWRAHGEAGVTMSGWIDDGGPQHDRPLRTDISLDDARRIIEQLTDAVALAERQQGMP